MQSEGDLRRWAYPPTQKMRLRTTAWTKVPKDDEEQNAALASIRKSVFNSLHDLAEVRLADEHRLNWRTSFDLSGKNSTYRRAEEIDRIYEEAAPLISSAMSEPARSFLHSLHGIVRDAVENAGGQFQQPKFVRPVAEIRGTRY